MIEHFDANFFIFSRAIVKSPTSQITPKVRSAAPVEKKMAIFSLPTKATSKELRMTLSLLIVVACHVCLTIPQTITYLGCRTLSFRTHDLKYYANLKSGPLRYCCLEKLT